ncbi:MAG: hypothetical protein D3910_14545 [Candidatus Electrothrix sp. ATG2]|nr:hypothetical protein [Candidatus Electrothrix sp. ATG2]
MDSSITIQGDAYFAMTPAVMMFGGMLDASYQSGNLHAWFDAHADVIIQWKPFWFNANIGITVGASYRIDLLFTSFTVSVELGCDLQLWGPPTGGKVHVDWYIISFTVPFGHGESTAKVLDWSAIEAMLPTTGNDGHLLSITAVSGLHAQATSPANTPTTSQQVMTANDASTGTQQPKTWTVRPSTFAFNTQVPIPSSKLIVGSTYTFHGDLVNVRPLNTGSSGPDWKNIHSTHTITIKTGNNDCSLDFIVSLQRQALPKSLWGSETGSRTSLPDSEQTVAEQIIGATVRAKPPMIGCTVGPVNVLAALAHDDLGLDKALYPLSVTADATGTAATNSATTISIIANDNSGIASSTMVTQRQTILTDLQAIGYAPATANDSMKNFVRQIGTNFCTEPLLSTQETVKESR